MMSLLPVGLLGLVFAALVAAIIASTASKINSVATIFTLDLYAKMKRVESRAQDAGQDADLTSAHAASPHTPTHAQAKDARVAVPYTSSATNCPRRRPRRKPPRRQTKE